MKHGHWRRRKRNISRLLKTTALGNYCESSGWNWWWPNKCTYVRTPRNNCWVMLDFANFDTLAMWWNKLTTALKTPWLQGLSRRLEVVVNQKYVCLTTSWHGLACQNPDCCMLQGTEGVMSDIVTMTWHDITGLHRNHKDARCGIIYQLN